MWKGYQSCDYSSVQHTSQRDARKDSRYTVATLVPPACRADRDTNVLSSHTRHTLFYTTYIRARCPIPLARCFPSSLECMKFDSVDLP